MKTIEKPILFTGKMVKAILENKKTVTRRLVDPQPPSFVDWLEYVDWIDDKHKEKSYFRGYMQPGEPTVHHTKAKYWPGLNLWVRESWGITMFSNNSGYEISVIYRADNAEKYYIDLDNEELWNRIVKTEKWGNKINWRSSLFIPRAASRILLKAVDVRIERLHELDDAEARLEGCTNREEYIKVWNDINAKNGYSWDKNPFVYRIDFERVIKGVS